MVSFSNILRSLILLNVLPVFATDDSLWSTYDDVVPLLTNSKFEDVTYTLKPFVIYATTSYSTESLSPESIQQIFSAAYNYDDLKYTERLQALILRGESDESNVFERSDVTLPLDAYAPAYHYFKTAPETCGTLHSEDGLELCGDAYHSINGGCTYLESYVISAHDDELATGYTFMPGCTYGGRFLSILLASGVSTIGTFGHGCDYEDFPDCQTGESHPTCTRDGGSSGFLVPYNAVKTYPDLDTLTPYAVSGKCYDGAECQNPPSWFL